MPISDELGEDCIYRYLFNKNKMFQVETKKKALFMFRAWG
jgi:hypothetical protein